MALESMGIDYEHVFSSDINPAVREVLRYNYGSEFTLYDDATNRKIKEMEPCDVYHAGFPCQPFSMAGLHRGTEDPRGMVVHHLLSYVGHHKPAVVIFENVAGLVLKHRELLDWILSRLRRFGYKADWKLLRAHEHGVPQNRDRVFIVAILKDRLTVPKLQWPSPLPLVPLASFLDKVKPTDKSTTVPPAKQGTRRKNVLAFMKKYKKSKLTDLQNWVVDVDGTKGHAMKNKSPCLTRSRAAAGGHWLPGRGRQMTEQEMERLFGLHVQPPNGGKKIGVKKPPAFSKRKWGAIIGNSIPVPVIARVLAKALPAAGIRCKDVWNITK